jgi:hypothetical protein
LKKSNYLNAKCAALAGKNTAVLRSCWAALSLESLEHHSDNNLHHFFIIDSKETNAQTLDFSDNE